MTIDHWHNPLARFRRWRKHPLYPAQPLPHLPTAFPRFQPLFLSRETPRPTLTEQSGERLICGSQRSSAAKRILVYLTSKSPHSVKLITQIVRQCQPAGKVYVNGNCKSAGRPTQYTPRMSKTAETHVVCFCHFFVPLLNLFTRKALGLSGFSRCL